MPVRIQRRRTKGWKAPKGAVNCTRPGKWGNSYRVGIDGTAEECVAKYRAQVEGNIWTFPTKQDIKEQLRGKDLMCFCGLNEICHVDVLLEIANK